MQEGCGLTFNRPNTLGVPGRTARRRAPPRSEKRGGDALAVLASAAGHGNKQEIVGNDTPRATQVGDENDAARELRGPGDDGREHENPSRVRMEEPYAIGTTSP